MVQSLRGKGENRMRRVIFVVTVAILLVSTGVSLFGDDGENLDFSDEILQCKGLYFEALPPAESAHSVEWLDDETVEFWYNLNGTSGITQAFRVDTYKGQNGGWYFLRTKKVFVSESASKEPNCRSCHDDRGEPCGAFESFRGECS
jgi:hypothetical protein